MSCPHNKHMAGCPHCRATATAYDRRRAAAIRNGTWLHRTPANQVLPHVTQLCDSKMSLAHIARTSGVSVRTLSDLVNGRRETLQGPNAAAILAVTPTRRIPAGMRDATGTARRIQALMAIGHSLTHQAGHLGRRLQRLWSIAYGQPTVTNEVADEVTCMYDRLSLTPGTSTRARNTAAKHGWPPPLAWDDDTIDDPDAQPNVEAPGVDWLAVELALAGQRHATLLHPADQAELYRQLAVEQGLTDGQIRHRLNLSQAQVNRLRRTWQKTTTTVRDLIEAR